MYAIDGVNSGLSGLCAGVGFWPCHVSHLAAHQLSTCKERGQEQHASWASPHTAGSLLLISLVSLSGEQSRKKGKAGLRPALCDVLIQPLVVR